MTDHRMMLVAAGGGVAFIHALHGRATEAQSWLEKLPTGDEAWWVSFAPTAARLALALVQIDRLELREAIDTVSDIDIARSPEYWAPYYALRAFLVAELARVTTPPGERGVAGPEAVVQALLSEFEAFVEALPPKYSNVPLNAEYTALIRYMLLLLLHQPDRAVRELDAEEIAPTASVVRQIGITLYANRLLQLGQTSAARRLVSPLLSVPDSRPRVLIPALMVAAQTDTIAQAERLAVRAVALANWNRSYIGFTLSTDAHRKDLADRLEALGEPVIAERLRSFSDLPTVPGFDALTRREAAVVGAALRGLSNAQIASDHAVSLNTVKAQVASAYRKLGVSTRAQLFELFHLSDGPSGRSSPS